MLGIVFFVVVYSKNFIYFKLFLAVLGLYGCVQAFSLFVVSGGYSLVAMRGLLIAEHGL